MLEIKHKVKLDIEANKVDLTNWLFTMTEIDYKDASHSHKKFFVSEDSKRKKTIICEESAGGTYIIQYYKEIKSATNYVKVESERSKVFIFHLFPFYVKVMWIMRVISLSDEDSELECHVIVKFSNKFLESIATLLCSRYIWTKHCIEETEGFKKDILRKINI